LPSDVQTTHKQAEGKTTPQDVNPLPTDLKQLNAF